MMAAWQNKPLAASLSVASPEASHIAFRSEGRVLGDFISPSFLAASSISFRLPVISLWKYHSSRSQSLDPNAKAAETTRPKVPVEKATSSGLPRNPHPPINHHRPLSRREHLH